jgi:hypothetical protein
MISRLESTYPGLAAALKRADLARQRKAVAGACFKVVSESGLSGRVVESALQALTGFANVSDEDRNSIRKLADDLDESYFKLEEVGDPAHIAMFSQARAASSLAFALGLDAESFGEALYEATSALDEPAPLIESISRQLSD